MNHTNSKEAKKFLFVQDLVIDTEKKTVAKGFRIIRFTRTEYNIFTYLLANAPRFITMQSLYEAVWGETYLQVSDNTVMVHISNMRKKLRVVSDTNQYIISSPGWGYKVAIP